MYWCLDFYSLYSSWEKYLKKNYESKLKSYESHNSDWKGNYIYLIKLQISPRWINLNWILSVIFHIPRSVQKMDKFKYRRRQL